MMDTNQIGNAGENCFALRLGKCGVFRVYFLGEKTPIEDFLLEIVDDKYLYQCLVQVKSTSKNNKYDKNGNMKVTLTKEKLKKLIDLPLPTYVAGVDLDKEAVYIVPAFDYEAKHCSIPTKIKIDKDNKEESEKNILLLKEDIITFWENIEIMKHKTNYKSKLL